MLTLLFCLIFFNILFKYMILLTKYAIKNVNNNNDDDEDIKRCIDIVHFF